MKVAMRIGERLNGRDLTPAALEFIRLEIESLDRIEAINDDIRGIVERNWPQVVSKFPRLPHGEFGQLLTT